MTTAGHIVDALGDLPQALEPYLTAKECQQLEAFRTANDETLAARWGIKETAVRKRKQRLRERLRAVTMSHTEIKGRGEEVIAERLEAAIREEGEKTREELSRLIVGAELARSGEQLDDVDCLLDVNNAQREDSR